MKTKILKFSLFTAILGFALWSCKKETTPIDNSNPQIKNASFLNQQISFSNSGEHHNYIMERVYNNLNENINDEDVIILENSIQTIKSGLIGKLNISELEYDAFINEIGFPTNISSETNFEAILEIKKDEALEKLSIINSDLSEDLDYFIDNSLNSDKEFFQNSLNNLKSKYLNTEHEDFILLVTSVAENSYNYWNQNFQEWNQNNSTEALNDAAKGVIKADISGAVVGGTWGGVTGAFAGGIGALPGALLGGMIASSYGSAVAGIWSFFGW